MAIDKGNIKTSANYDVRAQKPIDGRSVRPTKADLIKKESWSSDGNTVYVYEGMQVYVQDEKKTYYLKDITKLFADDFSGWELTGTGADSGGLKLRELKVSGTAEDNAYNLETLELMKENKVLPAMDGGDGTLVPLTYGGNGMFVVQMVQDGIEAQMMLTMAENGSISVTQDILAPLVLLSPEYVLKWINRNALLAHFGSYESAYAMHDFQFCLIDYVKATTGDNSKMEVQFNHGNKRFERIYNRSTGEEISTTEIPIGTEGSASDYVLRHIYYGDTLEEQQQNKESIKLIEEKKAVPFMEGIGVPFSFGAYRGRLDMDFFINNGPQNLSLWDPIKIVIDEDGALEEMTYHSGTSRFFNDNIFRVIENSSSVTDLVNYVNNVVGGNVKKYGIIPQKNTNTYEFSIAVEWHVDKDNGGFRMSYYQEGKIITEYYNNSGELTRKEEIPIGGGGGISEETEVYIGAEEPTDDGAKLWIDPSDEPPEEEPSSEIIVDTALNSNSNNPVSNAAITARFASMQTELATKQERLKSGENIKTIGGYSILGEGDIPLPDISGYMTQAAADSRYQLKGNYQPAGDYLKVSDVSKVGRSGKYEDLDGKPDIPVVDLVIDEQSNNAVANSAVKAYIDSLGVGPTIYREDPLPIIRTDDFTTYKYYPTLGKYNVIQPSDDHPTRIIHVDTNDRIMVGTENIITSWCIILIDTTNGKPTDWTFESNSGMWWKGGIMPTFEPGKFYVIKVHRHMFECEVFEFVK